MQNRWVQAALIGLAALSGADTALGEARERIKVEGDAIVYDGGVEVLDESAPADADVLRHLLSPEKTIRRIILTGPFAKTGGALDVARVIDDFDLDTEIRDECTDGCLYMFVAGEKRLLHKGAKLGVRRRIMSAAFVKDHFEARKARYGWEDEFGQAAMLYDVGQSDMRWALLYLMDHGVSLDFALRVFATPRDDMWWPERDELVEGGVIASH